MCSGTCTTYLCHVHTASDGAPWIQYIYIDINNRNWYSKHDYYLSSPHRIFKLTDLLIHRTFSCMFLTWLTFWFRRNEDGHVRWKKWIWKIIISYCHPLLTQRIRFRIGQYSFQWIKWIFNNRTNLMGLSLYFQCIQMFYLKKRTREHAHNSMYTSSSFFPVVEHWEQQKARATKSE